jgi:hypothetical protein
MQRDFTVRSVNLFSSFYNWSFPPEAWKYEPFKPKAIENIEQDYNFWKGRIKKHRRAKALLKSTLQKKWQHYNEIVINRFIYVNPRKIYTVSDASFRKFLELFSSYNFVYRSDSHGNIILHTLRFDSLLNDNIFLKKYARRKHSPLSFKDFYISDYFDVYKKFRNPKFLKYYKWAKSAKIVEDISFRHAIFDDDFNSKLKGTTNILKWNNFKYRVFNSWVYKFLALYDYDYNFFIEPIASKGKTSDFLSDVAELKEDIAFVKGKKKWRPVFTEERQMSFYEDLRHSSFFWKGFLKDNLSMSLQNRTKDYNDYFFLLFRELKKFDLLKLSWNNYFLDHLDEANFFVRMEPNFIKTTHAKFRDSDASLNIMKISKKKWYVSSYMDFDFDWEPGFVFDKLIPYKFFNKWPFINFYDVGYLNFYGWFSRLFFFKTLSSFENNIPYKTPLMSLYDSSYNLSFQNFLKSKVLSDLDSDFFNYKFFYKHFSYFYLNSAFFVLYSRFFFENLDFLADFSFFYQFFFLHLFFSFLDPYVFFDELFFFKDFQNIFDRFFHFYNFFKDSNFFFEDNFNLFFFLKFLNFLNVDSLNVFSKLKKNELSGFFFDGNFSDIIFGLKSKDFSFFFDYLNSFKEVDFLRWFFFFQSLDSFLFSFTLENLFILDSLLNFYMFFDKEFVIDFYYFYGSSNIEDILSCCFFEEDFFFEKSFSSFDFKIIICSDFIYSYFYFKHLFFDFFKNFLFFDFLCFQRVNCSTFFLIVYFFFFGFNFLVLIFLFYKVITRFFRFLFVFIKYFYYIFYYVFISLYDRDIYEWEESFFYTRPSAEDFELNLSMYGAPDTEILPPFNSDEVGFNDTEPGSLFNFFSKPFSFFLLKHLNYEFYYVFLEYFITALIRYYFCFFIISVFLFIVVLFIFFYVLIFFILFIYFFLLFVLFLEIYIYFTFFLNYFFI